MRTTADPDELEGLHALCRQGRLYDVERWIANGQPLQARDLPGDRRRRKPSALEIAIKQHHHALVLLLLCNGYDPNHEHRCALDVALEARQSDLVDLLLAWGADPHRVDLETLFDTYDASLFDRFFGLGVDLTRHHALAEALGFHTSNRPLLGFVKRVREADPRIQRDLDMALSHHAWEPNEKGAMLCLWAGGNPHVNVPSLRYGQDDEEDDGDIADGSSAACGACYHGLAKLLDRFSPDPEGYDFDCFYRLAHSPAVVDVLARRALPRDMTRVVQHLVQSSGWSYGAMDAVGGLRRVFEIGARWTEASTKDIAALRRTLYQQEEGRFASVVRILGTDDYCAPEIRRELGRTEAFQKRVREAGLLPKRGNRRWGE